jgi:hypothetical protein
MATPRRRLVRPLAAADPQRTHRRVQTLRQTLAVDRTLLARWLSRLRRSFHTVERLQAKIARAEWQITRLEDHP